MLEFSGALTVYQIPCLRDNYVFILHFKNDDRVVVVDPPEAKTTREFLSQRQMNLDEIWITHHHQDHVGGVHDLQNEYRCKVRGSGQRPGLIPLLTDPVEEKVVWSVGDWKVSVLFLPGHTLDHIGFWLKNAEESLLFSGDVLFGLGCGRVFEGSYEMMLQSIRTISLLPDRTLVFCSHEYAENNLNFAKTALGDSKRLEERIVKIQELRSKGLPTVPLTIAEEQETNPFLLSLRSDDPLATFSRFRDLRNKL